MSKETRPRLNKAMGKYVKSLKSDENRVLVIGDLHEPFCLDGYLEHCVKIRDKYNCNKVIFIGDVIDSHFSSFHTTDVDGLVNTRLPADPVTVYEDGKFNSVSPVQTISEGFPSD